MSEAPEAVQERAGAKAGAANAERVFRVVREAQAPDYARYVAILDGNYLGVVVRQGRHWRVNLHGPDRKGLEPCRSLREGRARLEAKVGRLVR